MGNPVEDFVKDLPYSPFLAAAGIGILPVVANNVSGGSTVPQPAVRVGGVVALGSTAVIVVKMYFDGFAGVLKKSGSEFLECSAPGIAWSELTGHSTDCNDTKEHKSWWERTADAAGLGWFA